MLSVLRLSIRLACHSFQSGSLLSLSAFSWMATFKFVSATISSKTSTGKTVRSNPRQIAVMGILRANKRPENWFFSCRTLTSPSQIFGLQFLLLFFFTRWVLERSEPLYILRIKPHKPFFLAVRQAEYIFKQIDLWPKFSITKRSLTN